VVVTFLALFLAAGDPAGRADAPRAPASPPRRPLSSIGKSAAEQPASALCRQHPLSPGQALRLGRPLPGAGEFRHVESGGALVSAGGALKSQRRPWLAHAGARRPPSAPRSLRILFCTWLA
jgi:hypothetical protein